MDKIITPTEFKEQMENIFSAEGYDKEAVHIEADGLICILLRSLGYGEGVDIFLYADKWYA